jgi:hypothetical protein
VARRVITFEPWIGEFGWELMSWQAKCRKISRDYDYAVCCSFRGMDALYTDFAEFLAHDRQQRSLTFPHKQYRIDGEWVRYGNARPERDILFHGRADRKCPFKNYRRWQRVAEAFPCAGWIGLGGDDCYGADYRNLPLQDLMDIIAGAKVVVGGSSGVMHLAQLCGTPVVAWGDNKTYYNESLERRYKETWNPFGIGVGWVPSDDWQPEPNMIEKEIENVLTGSIGKGG